MRVSREKCAESRKRILEAAATLFREKGFDGVCLADIMNAAGQTHDGFYGPLVATPDLRRRQERFGLFRDTNGRGAEVSCGNCMKERAHFFRALGSERLLELPLSLRPSFNRCPETGFAGLGHPQLLAAAITTALFDCDQSVALQWQDVTTERGSVHYHFRGERIDCHRT